MKREAGVTLIELLIAVSLVSLLSLGMLIAIRVGLNAMDKVNKRFTAERKYSSVERIIESQIAGMIPVTSQCRAAGNAKFVYFEGLPQKMTFVSSYSLEEAWRGYPRILEYSLIPGEKGAGYRLIVNEMVYPGPINAGFFCAGMANGVPQFNQTRANPRSFVLADNLRGAHFIYRQTLPAPENEKWTDVWTVNDRLPSGVRVEIPPRAPLTVPIHLTKWVLGPYADE